MSLFLSLFALFFIHPSLLAAAENVIGDTAPPPLINAPRGGAPLKPSISIVVGILTTFFSLTFLLLLYVKHCRRVTGAHSGGGEYGYGYPVTGVDRRNSGIDRAVIDSLPVFRFASLRGQKDGLECAVCLNRFEPAEVLRLLPKCKHAFHVECVDTWLDAHSTCPLCRYRVDPEDILLVNPYKTTPSPGSIPPIPTIPRVSGRHSFAGILETPKKAAAAERHSLDSSRKKKRSEAVELGCFDRPRKDELLLAPPAAEQRRLEHRIIIGGGDLQRVDHRWSDAQRSDLLFLQSEMIISKVAGEVMNERSVSEITGVSRYRSNEDSNDDDIQRRRRRQEGAVARWTAWISQNREQPNDTNISLAV